MTTPNPRDERSHGGAAPLATRGLGPGAGRIAAVAAVLGLFALALAWLLAARDPAPLGRFSFAYLPSFAFFLSISLGALFFVMLQHLTRAGWSVVVRRVAELIAANVALLALAALPVIVPALLGDGGLYRWADHARAGGDHLVHAKAAYLNGPFFFARVAFYFAVWALLARSFLRRSTEQDASGEPALTTRMEKLSAPGMVLFALTLTFAAFDLLMSLDPAWYSTIFGVYFFAGGAVAFFATLALMMMGLQATGRLRHEITVEHYHDVGKLLFAFVFFWGYIAFSQFMLIWYANIPEETRWYRDRFAGAWMTLAWLLVFGHFLVPFAGLMSRAAKRKKALLSLWAVLMLVMHYVDLYWLAVPARGGEGVPFGGVEVLCFLGLFGLYAAGLLWLGRARALVPVRDPRLGESLAFENI